MLFQLLPAIVSLCISIPLSNALNHRIIAHGEPSKLLLLPTNNRDWKALINASIQAEDTTVLPNVTNENDFIIWPQDHPSSALVKAPFNASSPATSVGGPVPLCDKKFGKNLRVDSCIEAFNKMVAGEEYIIFGLRGHGQWDANLPFRIYSTDGLCAIDIIKRAGVITERITQTDLKDNVRAIMSICIAGKENLGGVMSNIGVNGGLGVRVMPYKPNVHCDPIGTSPPWNDCRKIIDDMPAEDTKQIFGQQDDPDPTITVQLPAGYNTQLRRCQVYVDTLKPEVRTDTYDWYKLWAAANAVDYMCVQHKRSGLAIGHGKGHSLFVEIRDMIHPPRPSFAPALSES